jgi:heme/copper-type cytochrome/quinol oxidase subunit 2
MLVPVIVLGSGVIQSFVHVSISSWSLLEKYSPQMPELLRFAVFATIVIVIPVIVVLINILSIVCLQYHRNERVLNISIRMRTFNIIMIVIGRRGIGFLAL